MKRRKIMKMTENDIIAAYVRSRYPNLIKTIDYSTYAAYKRISSMFSAVKEIFNMDPKADLNEVLERAKEIEGDQEDGRYEEGSSDGSAEAPDGIRGEESICGEPVSDTEQGSDLQED